VPRIDAALEFAEKLLATNPNYAKLNPNVADRVKQIKGQNRNYVAHEYFNRDWAPMSFASMANWLAPAKLDFACSANYLDFVEAVNLTPEQQAMLAEIPDTMFRQTVRDFMVNQQFRKDYWVKGARKLSPLSQAEALRAQRVMLSSPRADVSLKIIGAMGEASMQEAIYNPILDALADHKPKSLGQLEQALNSHGIVLTQIIQAVMVLTGTGALTAVQEEAKIAKTKKRVDKLNAHLIDLSRGSSDIGYLCSPVTGGGVAINRFQQLFLLALAQGKKQPAEWAQLAWQILASQGQKLLKAGKSLDTEQENLDELLVQAQAFSSKQLPILKALQIA
jgi:hypothetical protein